jgi:hypothetical protein
MPARLHQAILPSHRRVCIQCGSRTLTGGRKTPQKNLANQTPHSLLLCDVYTNRVQLRHLQKRTPSTNESPGPLVTSPSRINDPSYGPHRPHKPHLLEIPTKGKPLSSALVCRTPGIPLENPARTREAPHLGRPTLLTTRGRQRRCRQRKHDPSPP